MEKKRGAWKILDPRALMIVRRDRTGFQGERTEDAVKGETEMKPLILSCRFKQGKERVTSR
jgi:hypothetical protein